jgi:predicted RNase H-like nuclease (RuvC/YqgF family)
MQVLDTKTVPQLNYETTRQKVSELNSEIIVMNNEVIKPLRFQIQQFDHEITLLETKNKNLENELEQLKIERNK